MIYLYNILHRITMKGLWYILENKDFPPHRSLSAILIEGEKREKLRKGVNPDIFHEIKSPNNRYTGSEKKVKL